MQYSEMIAVAKRALAETEARGFRHTAAAMRSVLQSAMDAAERPQIVPENNENR